MTVWHGCYDSGWKGLIGPESFSHPAKMARGLIERIYDYLLAGGHLKPGDTVVDPFGGIGTGGIVGASRGLRWIGVELEKKFAALAERNFELHRRTWEAMGDPLPRMVCGDSRKLCEVLAGADCLVSLPPYAEQVIRDREPGKHDLTITNERHGCTKHGHSCDAYGSSPGQLGAMRAGDVEAVVGDCIVSSPPYWDAKVGGNDPEVERNRVARKIASGEIDPATAGKYSKHSQDILSQYGDDPNNLGNRDQETFWEASKQIVQQCHAILRPSGMAADDPKGMDFCCCQSRTAVEYTHEENNMGMDSGLLRGRGARSIRGRKKRNKAGHKRPGDNGTEGRKTANGDQGISRDAGLQACSHVDTSCEAAQSAKPNECAHDLPEAGSHSFHRKDRPDAFREAAKGNGNSEQAKGSQHAAGSNPHASCSHETIGNDNDGRREEMQNRQGISEQLRTVKGNLTFLICRHCNKPTSGTGQTLGGIAVFVCKDFVRNKARVPFSDDWRKLCEACGFELVEWIRASLVKEKTVNGFFGKETERTERKSFFRRLAEKKGSPRIDHEDVLVMRRRP